MFCDIRKQFQNHLYWYIKICKKKLHENNAKSYLHFRTNFVKLRNSFVNKKWIFRMFTHCIVNWGFATKFPWKQLLLMGPTVNRFHEIFPNERERRFSILLWVWNTCCLVYGDVAIRRGNCAHIKKMWKGNRKKAEPKIQNTHYTSFTYKSKM